MDKQYLGDGLYANYDGYQIVLTAEDGISVSNEVFLDPQVFNSLLNYAEKVFGVVITAKRKEE